MDARDLVDRVGARIRCNRILALGVVEEMLTARIAKPGHKYDGKEVIITHLGLNGHPYLDHAYGYSHATIDRRTVAVLISSVGQASELLDTFTMDELVI